MESYRSRLIHEMSPYKTLGGWLTNTGTGQAQVLANWPVNNLG